MRIVIAEDQVLLREGLARLLLGAGYGVVAQVGDGRSLVAEVSAQRPDLVIADIRMPPRTPTRVPRRCSTCGTAFRTWR